MVWLRCDVLFCPSCVGWSSCAAILCASAQMPHRKRTVSGSLVPQHSRNAQENSTHRSRNHSLETLLPIVLDIASQVPGQARPNAGRVPTPPPLPLPPLPPSFTLSNDGAVYPHPIGPQQAPAGVIALQAPEEKGNSQEANSSLMAELLALRGLPVVSPRKRNMESCTANERQGSRLQAGTVCQKLVSVQGSLKLTS